MPPRRKKPPKFLVCWFPGCGRQGTSTSEFDNHHIVPRSMGGPDIAYNVLTCCPSCHRKIHVPGIQGGYHAQQLPGGVVILRYVMTDKGRCIYYRRLSDGMYCTWSPGTPMEEELSSPLY